MCVCVCTYISIWYVLLYNTIFSNSKFGSSRVAVVCKTFASRMTKHLERGRGSERNSSDEIINV